MTEEPMNANVEKLIKDGIRAYNAKNRAEAHSLFEKATELDPYSEQAWLWLSAVVDTEEDQRVCLENVLYINPDNPNAKKGIDKLNAKSKPQEAPPPAAPPPPPAPVTPAPAPIIDPPTATSSASSVYSGPELSGEDYDDWVAGLPLPASQNSMPSSSAPFTDPSALFSDSDFDSSFTDAYEVESSEMDDMMGDDPFGASSQTYSDDDDDDDVFGDAPQSTFQTGPFSTSTYDDNDVDSLLGPSSPAPAPRSTESRFSSATRSPVGGSVFTDDLRASVSEVDESDAGEYFRMIPMDIKPTRLPGTREGYPLLLILGIVGLLMANGAALFMLINRLAG